MRVINILANVTTSVGSIDASTEVGPGTIIDEPINNIEPTINP